MHVVHVGTLPIYNMHGWGEEEEYETFHWSLRHEWWTFFHEHHDVFWKNDYGTTVNHSTWAEVTLFTEVQNIPGFTVHFNYHHVKQITSLRNYLQNILYNPMLICTLMWIQFTINLRHDRKACDWTAGIWIPGIRLTGMCSAGGDVQC